MFVLKGSIRSAPTKSKTLKSLYRAAISSTTSKSYPMILRLIRRYISKLNFTCCVNHKEGRRNSQDDEDKIITELERFFNRKGKKRIISSRNRWWYDFLVVDNKTGRVYPVNFKSTTMQSRPDNTGQKVGMLYGLTSIRFTREMSGHLTIPQLNVKGEIGWDTFDNLLVKNKGDGERDYYYVVLNKENTSTVLLVGLRDMVISNQTRNSAQNLPFQTNWTNNLHVNVRHFNDAWKHVVEQYKKNVECLVKIHSTILDSVI
jgi:hypothetical protein